MVDGGQLITPGLASPPPPPPAKIDSVQSTEKPKNENTEIQSENKTFPKWVWWTIGWLAFLLITLGGVYVASLFQDQESPEIKGVISPTPTAENLQPAIFADIPPLYPDLDWEATESDDFEFTTNEGDLISLQGNVVSSKETKEFPEDFVDYYIEKLTALGWNENLSVHASGPGGGVYGYYKNEQYFEFSISPTQGEPGGDFEAYRAEIKYTTGN